jgi:hypothetical protein
MTKQPSNGGGLISNDAIGAALDELGGETDVIYHPIIDAQSQAVAPLDECALAEVEGTGSDGDLDTNAAKTAPMTQPFWAEAQASHVPLGESYCTSVTQPFDGSEATPREARQEHPLFGPDRSDQVQQLPQVFRPCTLHVHVEGGSPERLEHALESEKVHPSATKWPCPRAIDKAPTGIPGVDLCPVTFLDPPAYASASRSRSIVRDHEDAISTGVDVQLKDVNPDLDGSSKRFEAVLGILAICAAMRVEQWPATRTPEMHAPWYITFGEPVMARHHPWPSVTIP